MQQTYPNAHKVHTIFVLSSGLRSTNVEVLVCSSVLLQNKVITTPICPRDHHGKKYHMLGFGLGLGLKLWYLTFTGQIFPLSCFVTQFWLKQYWR